MGGFAANMKSLYNRASPVEKQATRACGQGKPYNRAFGARKCTPIPACGGTSPQESMSLDSQVALLPYESCSFATPKGEVYSLLSLELT